MAVDVLKILFVDDGVFSKPREKALRGKAIREKLKENGFPNAVVDFAGSVEGATVAWISAQDSDKPYNIVILDRNLPKTDDDLIPMRDGRVVLNDSSSRIFMRDHIATARIQPILILWTSEPGAWLQHSGQYISHDLIEPPLRKPIDPEEMGTAVAEIASRRFTLLETPDGRHMVRQPIQNTLS